MNDPEESPTTWLDTDGKHYTFAEVMNVMKLWLARSNECQVVIGTDSNSIGRKFRFITALCIYQPRYGGNYFYSKTYEPHETFKKNSKLRLFHEVSRSLGVAEEMKEALNIAPVVHVDASPKTTRKFSSTFSDQLKGYVIASGFECVLKPDSWGATSIANRHTR